MNISPELLYAILAMDSYNRGYDAGIALPDAKGTAIGPAKISDRIQDFEGFASQAQAAGFYASAYNTPYGKVISYRGMDNLVGDPRGLSNGLHGLMDGPFKDKTVKVVTRDASGSGAVETLADLLDRAQEISAKAQAGSDASSENMNVGEEG